MNTFDSHDAFRKFEREVSRKQRYIRTLKAEQFLEAVITTCLSRTSRISNGRTFWRAQEGHDWQFEPKIGDNLPAPHLPKRMMPLSDRAMEGRANSKGIPVLYVCSNKDAAMCEIRPWLGSYISLARIRVNHDLKIVDCTKQADLPHALHFERPPNEEIDHFVWSDIDRAFKKPVTRSDDSGDYVATQILTELFRNQGFDGIAYRSAFGEKSTNYALFNLDCAEVVSCELHEATSARINFRPRGNQYWVSKKVSHKN